MRRLFVIGLFVTGGCTNPVAPARTVSPPAPTLNCAAVLSPPNNPVGYKWVCDEN